MTGSYSMNSARPVPLEVIKARGMGHFAQDEPGWRELKFHGWHFHGTPTEDSEMRPPDLGLEPPRPLPWAGQAACKNDPGPWMALPGEGQGEAITICLQLCPVLDECRRWSGSEEARRTGMVVAGIAPESPEPR